MLKWGRKGKGESDGRGQAPLEGAMASLALSSPTQSSAISLFPARPARKPNEKPPGTPVQLLTNLFRLHVKQNKPIYKCTVNVNIEESSIHKGGGNASKPPGDARTAAVERKLSKEIRLQAVEAAIKEWIRDNKPVEYSSKLEYHYYVFDSNGSVVYSLFDMFAKRPGDKDQEIAVKIKIERIVGQKLSETDRCFRVKLFKQGQLDMQRLVNFCLSAKGMSTDITTIQEELKAVNVIMRGKISAIPINVLTPLNVFPYKSENQFKISEGVLGNRGYSLSARPTESGMALNIAETVAAFIEPVSLVELLKSRFFVKDLTKPLQARVIENLFKEIKNKQVEARHINYGSQASPHYRKYRVIGLSGSCKDKFLFANKETKEPIEITIEDYFKKVHKSNLKYPNLPCVVDRGRKIPLEVCHLVEKQRITRRMDPRETSEVIRYAALPPKEHFEQIDKHVEEVFQMRAPLIDFGLDFDAQNIRVQGRELGPIPLLGAARRDMQPNNGEYNAQRDNFVSPVTLKKWILTFMVDRNVKMDIDRQRGDLSEQRFSQLYCESGRFKGAQALPMCECNRLSLDMQETLIKETLKRYFIHLNETKVEFSIFVLPEGSPDWLYRYLQFLEVSERSKRGPNENSTRIACLKYSNYKNKIINGRDQGRMFLANLWLKHNTKLGGVNFVLKNIPTLKFLQDGYLFISVDVCHPSPGDKLPQSVAAVVGMWDLTNPHMSYCTRLRVQKKDRPDNSTVEDVGEIGLMVEDVLDSYKAKKGKYPSNVVILRDGVSEGQFKIVLEGELRRVRGALSKKYSVVKAKLPSVSCFVVQKRHKVRFMRVQPAQGRKGPDYNIQPGTVVDSGVVHPRDFSFYLAPHKAIQGTSRAPHIYIIHDEIGFSQDDAQSMIHALSYLSPRCTKSTSIPTPVNLADLAAERGKNIVICWNDANAYKKLNDEERLKQLNQFLSNMADKNHKNTLFYV